MKKNQLLVRLYGEWVGILEQTSTGKMQFTYEPSARQAISIHLPLREEPYGEIPTEAYFGGLLPESESVKKIIAQRHGISHNNPFALLKAIGYDCAGAISCHATEALSETQRSFPLSGRIITEEELYKHIKALPRKPLFMDVDGLRLSLAGVHDKAAVCLVDNQIALAENGCPTTHILKPSVAYFEGIAENGYFCLRLAKRLGLPVPAVELRQINDLVFLLIERFDRRINNGFVERIHQEDFCQALGVLSAKKYQNEGGPGFKECFELLKKTTHPAVDRNILASALVFNYLMCNMDAHGKNFSLLHLTPSQMRLAPLYDIVCTRAYSELIAKMAMKIGGKYDPDLLFPRHWQQLCEAIQYNYSAMKHLIENHAGLLFKMAIEEKNCLMEAGFNVSIIDKIIRLIQNNIHRTLTRL